MGTISDGAEAFSISCKFLAASLAINELQAGKDLEQAKKDAYFTPESSEFLSKLLSGINWNGPYRNLNPSFSVISTTMRPLLFQKAHKLGYSAEFYDKAYTYFNSGMIEGLNEKETKDLASILKNISEEILGNFRTAHHE